MGFEIKVGDYGRMMFEIMVGGERPRGKRGGLHNPKDHWESIRAEAEPLVRQLIALNEKMYREPGTEPYAIIGLVKEDGKKTLSEYERIVRAQTKLWGVLPRDLKVGDRIWIRDEDAGLEMYIGESRPLEVEEVTEKAVYIDRGREGTYKIQKTYRQEEVPSGWLLRAPADYDDPKNMVDVTRYGSTHKDNKYDTGEYWLEQAKILGIG